MIVAVLVLLTIVIVGMSMRSRYDTHLSGYWVGDTAFLEKSKLKDIQLFIAPVEDGARSGYLIMTDANGDYISNQAVTITAGASLWSALKNTLKARHDQYTVSAEIEYDGTVSASSPMPTAVRLTLSILDGTLTIYDKDKVWAHLVRDNQATGPALAAYDAK
jgi:hypothetical protein